jgi:NADH:ubiquinone oxidoreductase subunit E
VGLAGSGVSHHGGTRDDGMITIQEAQCLGFCDHAPCIQVDAEKTVGPLAPEAASQLVDDLRTVPAPDEFWR